MTARVQAWLVLLGALALVGSAPPVLAQEPSREALLKSAYLNNFGLYCVWPTKAGVVPEKEFVIGVLGKDTFEGGLDRMAAVNKEIFGKKIVIQRFPTMQNYKPCNILFISAQPAPLPGNPNAAETPADRLAAAVKQLKGEPVLLVGDTDGLMDKGAMIHLFLAKDNTVKYTINPTALKDAGLRPKAELLKFHTPKPK